MRQAHHCVANVVDFIVLRVRLMGVSGVGLVLCFVVALWFF